MIDLLVAAVPAFVLLMAVEMAAYWLHRKDQAAELANYGYDLADTRTSLSMGIGNLIISALIKGAGLVLYAACYQLTPIRFELPSWLHWLLLAIIFDFFFYVDHRAHHRVRLAWASHVVHHSSQYFNLSTALRQTWTPFTGIIFFVPVALLGYSPAEITTIGAVNLLVQFWIHTEKIDKMPRWFEYVFNTPSHHRVHHGSDLKYLDCNYGGWLIIWDRMFGSFVPEQERPNYGLTKNIETHNLVKVAFHEWTAMGQDVRRAKTWRAKLGYLFGPPGWQPKPKQSVEMDA